MRKSYSAGRFICNWMYFRSLRQAQLLEQPNWYSVFVHVPPFHRIPKDQQLNTIASMMQVIGEAVKTQPRNDADAQLSTSAAK